MFHYDADIPTDFALAIWRVAHNRAVYDTWEIIDKYEKEPRLDWVKRIFLSNTANWTPQEEAWWRRQFQLHPEE